MKKVRDIKKENIFDFVKKRNKQKVTNAGREEVKLMRELDYLFNKKSKRKYEQKEKKWHGFSGKKINQKIQNCIVKVSYEPNNIEKHKKFFAEYMQKKNDKNVIEKPVLFNADYDEAPDEEIENYIKHMSGKFFRFIVSPQNEKVPIELLIKKLMANVEKETNKKLMWFAAKHTDTDHTHAHIVINGVDKFGNDVSFSGEEISHLFRFSARKICTELVGYRTEKEIELDKQKLPQAKRFCSIDEAMKQREKEITDSEEYEATIIPWNNQTLERCAKLVELGFAKRIEKTIPRKYFLEKGWTKKLKTIGRYNSFLKARDNLKYTSTVNLIQYESEMGAISGIITRIYKMNYEDSWTNAYVIENKAKNIAWYVPLRKEPSEKLLNATVTLNSELNSRGKLTPRINVMDWGK